MPPKGWKKTKDASKPEEPVGITNDELGAMGIGPVGDPDPVPEPPPGPAPGASEPLGPPSKEEARVIRFQQIRSVKEAWQAAEKVAADARADADAKKAEYEHQRSRLGQDDVDWARTVGLISHI